MDASALKTKGRFDGPTEDQTPDISERLLYRGAAALSDVELLCAVLGRTGLEPGARLLDRFGELTALERASARQLCNVGRIPLEQAVRLSASLALARRLITRPAPHKRAIGSAADVWRVIASRLGSERRELFWALALDCQNRLQAELLISIGTLTAVDIHMREAFRPLVQEGAAHAIFVHNHPSGDPKPSPDDQRLSKKLAHVGETLGIRVLDHIVVARESYASAMHEPHVQGMQKELHDMVHGES